MWTDSVEAWSPTPAHLVLLEEACRTADRCALLDSLIRGHDEDSGDGGDESGGDSGRSPRITDLLAEVRAQQVALKGLIAELRQGQRQAAGSAGKPGAAATDAGGDVADLTARIAGRRQTAQG